MFLIWFFNGFLLWRFRRWTQLFTIFFIFTKWVWRNLLKVLAFLFARIFIILVVYNFHSFRIGLQNRIGFINFLFILQNFINRLVHVQNDTLQLILLNKVNELLIVILCLLKMVKIFFQLIDFVFVEILFIEIATQILDCRWKTKLFFVLCLLSSFYIHTCLCHTRYIRHLA